MRTAALRLAVALAVVVAAAPFTACEDDSAFVLPLPAKLRLTELTPAQRGLVRAELSIPGLLAPTELELDDTGSNLRGAFVVAVEEAATIPVTLRVSGRLRADTPEVLLALAVKDVDFAPRTTAHLEFADDDWAVDGGAAFDGNGNGVASIDDLVAGFDPAAPGALLNISPDALQFPSGLSPGDQARQVIIVENVSGLPQQLSAEIIGGQGMSLVLVDATGTPDDGAPRKLAPFVLQPFQEQILAVTFAPTNGFLARGGLALSTLHEPSNVRSVSEVGLFANSDGDPQPVLAGYDAGSLDGASVGFDGDVLPYPPTLLFGGQPLAPGTIPLSATPGDVLTVPSLPYPTSSVATSSTTLPASAVFLVQIPPRHRLAVEVSGLVRDVDLGLFLLNDAGAVSAVDGETFVSKNPGLSPEVAQFRNASTTEARRAIIVLSRVDDRVAGDDTNDTNDTVPFQLLTQLNAGPEFSDDAPIAPLTSAFRGGTTVTLHGIAFESGATVRFGNHVADRASTNVSDDGTTITTVTPRADESDVGEKVAVIVINPDGQAATHPPIFVYDPPAPEIDDVDPPTASTLGGTPLTVRGAFFGSNSRVRIGGTDVNGVVVTSSSRLDLIAPPGAAGFTQLVVLNENADGSSAQASVPFVYVAPDGAAPVIDAVAPDTGALSGGTAVTITGSNFVNGAAVRVSGSAANGVVVVDANHITCFTPPAFSAGPALLTVTNPDGQSASSTYNYFRPAPAIISVVPPFASTLGGTRLSIDGRDFDAGATALFGAATAAAVVDVVSSTRLLVTAPAGLAPGASTLTIVNSDGQASAPADITIFAPTAAAPRILSLAPAAVRVDNLVDVTVNGSGFQTGLVVLVDATEVTATAVTATSLRFTAPAHASGTAVVRVTNPDGQSDSEALRYDDALDAVFTSVSPESVGALIPGDVITVRGENLPPVPVDERDAAVHVESASGAVFATTVLNLNASTLQVRLLDPLPDDADYVVVLDVLGARTLSPPFAALAPSLISQQVIAGQPQAGSAFTLLVQGANLNRDHLGAVRFTHTVGGSDVVELAPQVRTSSLVRVDVGATALSQGTWAVSLRWDFVDKDGNADSYVDVVPGDLVIFGECGNGVVDAGEDCDGLAFAGVSCADVGFFGGSLACSATCQLLTNACTNCGNDIIDSGEECDGSNVGGTVCLDGDPDFTGGTPSCTDRCLLTFATCTICGNGLVEAGEQCDGNNNDGETCATLGLGFGSGGLACRGDCRFDTVACDSCGDGRCGASEDRDCSPNFAGCSVCTGDCVATCGDGTCGVGESCQTCPKDCAAQCDAPFSLALTSGGAQVRPRSSDLALPAVVTATDSTGAPLVGVQIVFTPPPGGNASPATTFTNASGAASSLLTLPRASGAVTFTASGSGPDGSVLVGAPVAINATGVDLNTGDIQTLANQFGIGGRTPLLDGAGAPITAAAAKVLLSLDSALGSGIAFRESDSSIFFADTANQRVLRIDRNGVISHVAGSINGVGGFSGDNGPARTALLNTPRGLALNAAGELFIADSTNNRVRRVDGSGVITTVAGGDVSTLEGVLATTAQLFAPTALLFDAAGNLFIQNTSGAQLIRKVSASAQTITTVVTSGTCGAGVTRVSSLGRTQMTLDRQGRLVFIGDVSNAGGCPIAPNVQHVLRLENDGTLSTLIGGSTAVTLGQARGARLENAIGVAADAAGNVFVSEAGTLGRRIRRVTPLGVVSTVVGTGVAGNSGDGAAATAARLTNPGFLAMNSARDLFFVDFGTQSLREVRAIGETTPPTVVISLIGNNQTAPVGQPLAAPLGLRVVDNNNNPVVGATLTVRASPGAAAEGNALQTDANGTGTFVGFVGRSAGLYTFVIDGIGADALPLPGSPFTLTATATDVADGTVVAVLDQEGASGNTPAGGAATRTRINTDGSFSGIAVDPDDGTLYVADVGNQRILRVDPNGLVTQIAGTGVNGRGGNGPALTIALSFPRGLALDDDNNLYIADTNNDLVRVLKTADQNCGSNGCSLTIFAGNNLNDTNPADGVVATGANLDSPVAIAVAPDNSGLIIVDTFHNRIRKVAVDPANLGVPGVITSIVTGASCSSATGVRVSSFSNAGAGLAFDHGGHLYFAGTLSNSGGCPAPNPNEQYVFRLEDDGKQTLIAGGDVERTTGAAFGTDLDEPAGLAVDNAGNLLIVERNGHRIRRVDVLGRMTVALGDGVAGRSGDNGPVSGLRMNFPSAIAYGPGADLYIADGSNFEVRRVTGFGDDVAASARVVLDSGNAQSVVVGQNTLLPLRIRVLENGTNAPVASLPVGFTGSNPGDSVFAPVTATDSIGFAATTVRLGRSLGATHAVAVSATTWLETVPLGGLPLTFTIAGLSPPPGASAVVANSLGQAGALPPNGTGDSLPAVEAKLSLTGAGIAIGSDGTLYVADADNQRILEVSPEGVASVFAGSGTAGFVDNTDAANARFSTPSGVAIDGVGNVYVADTGNRRIRKIDTSGNVTTLAGGNPVDPASHGDGNDPAVVNFSSVEHLAFGPDGALYVSDAGHDTIRRIVLSPFAISTPVLGTSCNSTTGLRASDIQSGGFGFDSSGRLVVVASVSNGGGCAFTTNTPLILRSNDALNGAPSTSFTIIAGSPTLANTGDGRVANDTRLTDVRALVINPANDDIFFVESFGSHRLRRIPGGSPTALVQPQLGVFNTAGFSAFTAAPPATSQLTTPHGLVRDPATGALYLTEDGADSIRIFIP